MSAIGREELDISHRAETGMFGNKRDPAKLPRSEPLILLALDVVMAVALTLGYYACWLEDEGGFRIGTTVLIEPTVDGSGSGGATVTAHPIDAHSDLSEGPVRLTFVSFLGSLLPGEFSGGSSERLGDIASSAREALG